MNSLEECAVAVALSTSYGGGSGLGWAIFRRPCGAGNCKLGKSANRYVTTILENFIFMNDNARPHTAQIVRQCLQEARIVTMNWPVHRADLNPIYNLWNNMRRSLKTLYPPALTLGDLGNHLTEILNTVDQNEIRRCPAVINARGGGVINLFLLSNLLKLILLCFKIPCIFLCI
jgi:hypothetical protein